MAAATLSSDTLEPLLGATTGAKECGACLQIAVALIWALLMVKHVVFQYCSTCCSTDRTAASTCILAEGMQQADERAAKKVRCLSVPGHATLAHEAQASLWRGHFH